jgi:cysteine desulfurase/selenocysteine lyase
MVLPPGQDGFEPTDEAFVARLANEIFRAGQPDLASTESSHVDSGPGPLDEADADLAAAARANGDPGVLGLGTPGPSSFDLASAPLGMALPTQLTELTHLPQTGQPMVSQAPALEALLGLEQAFASVPLTGHAVPPAAPSIPPIGEPGSLYFLELRPRAGSDEGVATKPSGTGYDPEALRRDFPALQQEIHGKRLIWLDNAATTQKPQSVIDAVSHFYERDNSNVHRGAHELAARATDAYEGARAKVAGMLGAASPREVIFVRGTTEAINLVAQSYGRSVVGEGDEIVLTVLEHHSNIVPWQLLAKETGATLKPVQITDRGDVLLDHYASLLGPRTRIVAVSQVSNALGTIVPVEAMAAMARAVGAVVVVDGAQAVPHMPVDVQALGADFYAFSGHKLYGPTGVGVLWGREALLDAMPPWQGGGQMIKTVTFESSTWNDLPYKFEAGTGTLAPAVGLGAAIDYVTQVGLLQIAAHEQELLAHGTGALAAIPGLRLIGTSQHKAGVMSFVLDGVDVEDVGRFLNNEGIAVRAGHHCAQPVLRHFGLDGTVRPSLGLYNTHEDVEQLAAAVQKAAKALTR